MIMQGSCSEATMILDISDLTNIEEAEIIELLKELEKDEENWIDTSWTKSELPKRKVKLIRIHGDTPYNNAEWLENKIREKFSKIDIAVEET